jgi:hypothetical protein
MFIINDRYKNYGLEYTMSYTLTQYQTTPGISRDYVSTFELGSFSANTVQGTKAWRPRTREKRDSNTKVKEKKARGRRRKDLHQKRSPPTLFLLFTDFYYYFNWLKLKILFYSFFNIWTKNVFPHFSANDCDLILHIMLALGYYHSMMLRGDQSLLRGHSYSTETTSCWQLYCCTAIAVQCQVMHLNRHFSNQESSALQDEELIICKTEKSR